MRLQMKVRRSMLVGRNVLDVIASNSLVPRAKTSVTDLVC